ncbi:DUF1194 domain-containing protein [Amorphus orientalis]|uniref:DUF1194 domain-containing protein n=1 Tax=Amorphus orientalis TaxID=649198 RepID=A0AAE3VS42_9HYPH|nr:DUF1194 domain-containing protein [Amorphus orientalis]MDQ0316938.1 hypothetical protein [Amorphus orientalis]
MALLAALAPAAPAVAQVEDVVDIELVLAVDVSWSMDHDEQLLQRQGYVGAFLHPDVLAAIEAGDWGRIAVTYVEWAGAGLQQVVVPWTLVDGPDSAEAFAARLAAAPLGRLRRTSISGALAFTGTLFDDNGYEGFRRVIDMSGDGPNNMGPPVTEERDKLIEAGITVNGLPIMIRRSSYDPFFQITNLDVYYEDCVIGGFGAFMVVVKSADEFADAIRRKLILEIAGAKPQTIPAQQILEQGPRIDCLIGEKLWQRWRGGP